MGGTDRGTRTKSSITGIQEPVAQAMFEIFKSNLSRGQSPGYPGSQAVTPFTPQAVQGNFRRNISDPLQNLYQQNFAGLIGPGTTEFAQGRRDETLRGLSSQFARRGEGLAYNEWLRTQPESLLGIGQSYLNIPQYGAFVPERGDLGAANVGLTGLNAWGQFAAYQGLQDLNTPPAINPTPWATPGGTMFNNNQFNRQFLR